MPNDRLDVFACWNQARQEYPDDPHRQKMRYVELMRENKHIVKKGEPGWREDPNLPCGWPGRPKGDSG